MLCLCAERRWLIMEAYEGLIAAALVSVLRQKIMQEGGEDFAQAAAGAVDTAVICQDQACLCHCLCCETAVVACCYQRPCA